MVADPIPFFVFPESALMVLTNLPTQETAIKQRKTASFCFSDLYLRKAHKFSNEIHK